MYDSRGRMRLSIRVPAGMLTDESIQIDARVVQESVMSGKRNDVMAKHRIGHGAGDGQDGHAGGGQGGVEGQAPALRLACCWAHVRRDFIDAARRYPEEKAWMFGWVDTIRGACWPLADSDGLRQASLAMQAGATGRGQSGPLSWRARASSRASSSARRPSSRSRCSRSSCASRRAASACCRAASAWCCAASACRCAACARW
jgi:hypothetical protein